MEFKKLRDEKINEVEKYINKEWNGVYTILNKTIENRKDNECFVFYDGPATANGFPGLHHMMAKFLKDTFCKYQTMRGHKVLRKVGWDTHGLPVELQVEKELGFSGKKDIEKYGVEKFNKECKNIVWKQNGGFYRNFLRKVYFMREVKRYPIVQDVVQVLLHMKWHRVMKKVLPILLLCHLKKEMRMFIFLHGQLLLGLCQVILLYVSIQMSYMSK